MVIVYPAIVKHPRLRKADMASGMIQYMDSQDENIHPTAFKMVIAHNGTHHFCPCGKLKTQQIKKSHVIYLQQRSANVMYLQQFN